MMGVMPSARALGALLVLLLGSACGSAATERQRNEKALAEDSASMLFKKGQVAASIGDMTRAEQYLVAALKAGGAEKPITEKLIVVCSADQRYPAALEYAEQYLYRHPRDVEVTFAAASIYAALGQMERARTLLEQVVGVRPEWSEPHYVLATVLREHGESLSAAERHDLEYLRLDPDGRFAERARARLSRGEQ